MMSLIRYCFFILVTISITYSTEAQSVASTTKETVKAPKPFRIITSGKEITVKSTKNIKSIMVWTAGGHRLLEQKDINAASYNFRITVNENIFFLMVQMADGKVFSEKIGIR